jgi:hypothetical protein
MICEFQPKVYCGRVNVIYHNNASGVRLSSVRKNFQTNEKTKKKSD